jgi:superfamily II DNA or RNA helicase
MEQREYQTQAVLALSKQRRGICVAPAGSGKTIIAAQLCERLVSSFQTQHPGFRPPLIAWLAHTKEQVEQGIEAVSVKVKADTWACYAYHCYAAYPDLSAFDMVILDECHWAGCEMLLQILATMKPGARLYGFTATPKREDGIDVTEIVGPILYSVEPEEIEKIGGILPGIVRVVELGLKNALDTGADALAKTLYTNGMRWHDAQTGTDTHFKRCTYRAVCKLAISENEERDKIIRDIAARHAADKTLILVDSKKHGAALARMIPRSAALFSQTRNRAGIVADFRDGDLPCLIATSLADEGLDVPCANVLIMAGAGKAFGKIVQRTGRVLRPYPDKTAGVIYDFLDTRHGMLVAQHWQRRRHYRRIGYAVQRA